MAFRSREIVDCGMKERKSEQGLLQESDVTHDFQQLPPMPVQVRQTAQAATSSEQEKEAELEKPSGAGSQDLTSLGKQDEDSIIMMQILGENRKKDAKSVSQVSGLDDTIIEPERLSASRPTLRVSFESMPKEPDILAEDDPEQEESQDYSHSLAVPRAGGLALTPRRATLLAANKVTIVRTKSARLGLKPVPDSGLVSKRIEILPRTESDTEYLISSEFRPLQVLNYSQGLSALRKTDLRTYINPPERENFLTRLVVCFRIPLLQNRAVVSDYELMLALEKRRFNLKIPLDLDLLYSIWKVLIPHTDFTLANQCWALLGLPASEALQMCNTWGLLQLLYCLSESRALALDLFKLSKTSEKAFSFTARSLTLSSMCLRVAKTGRLNRYFDKYRSVFDVINALYLGSLVRWTQLHLQHAASDQDLEKDIRAKPAKYIQLGLQQTRL